MEKRLAHIKEPITVAVMGCVVNGPGEAREADVGIAGGKGVGLLFKYGEIVKKLSEEGACRCAGEEVEEIVEKQKSEVRSQ